jgi:hypothetical protein
VPEGATKIAVLVQCSGADITLTSEVADPTDVPCDDPSRTTRVEFPAVGLGFGVQAGADGPVWVHLVAEANGEISAARPTAPPMPADLVGLSYADADGEYLALGTLGSERQTIPQMSGAQAGLASGDFVGVTTPDDSGGMTLELWSIAQAKAISTLAQVSGPDRIYRSWVDATHEQVFYGISTAAGFAAEWHRVAFDGSGDTVIGKTAPGIVLTSEVLALDDSVFVVDWCIAIGPCTRIIHDSETGTDREVVLTGDRRCHLVGAVDGRIVAQGAATCDDAGQTTIEALDGGQRRVLVDRPVPASLLVRSSDGPQLIVATGGETRTTYRIVGLDGGEPREIAVFEHEPSLAPQPSQVRLPAGDWVLLAGPLADTPSNRSLGRATPVLLNVATGEMIELVNLPRSSQ